MMPIFLIAADCTAYSYSRFHEDFIKGRITLIGCPKLDDGDYSEKLTEIFTSNEIKSIHLVRMMVPCCGGLQNAAIRALQNSGKFIPWQVVTISVDGKILDQASNETFCSVRLAASSCKLSGTMIEWMQVPRGCGTCK